MSVTFTPEQMEGHGNQMPVAQPVRTATIEIDQAIVACRRAVKNVRASSMRKSNDAAVIDALLFVINSDALKREVRTLLK